MSVTQLVTFIAAGLGAWLGAFLTRRNERVKHLQELRSAAYIDFVRGIATAVQQGGDMAQVADARARIAIYGGKTVVRSLSAFIERGSQTENAEGMLAFAELCKAMRTETGREYVRLEDIDRILFS
jgi:hypothetical protein